ncbi:hypothetical protein JRQ81_014710 [Phrynocephalus forsythii]|uniref:Selenoprotein F n=1 Tax=Phrynocephalus forsythii TaxID=171643 RepID=A0A9Q0XZ86_9SAUR|nr:hypothetical protein JRQ81_014710 [Phrynocephalus forsythii]
MATEKGAGQLGRCWLWLLATLQAVSVYGAELSSEACRELGFSSNLLCSSCDLLGQFGLNQLDPFCRKCCQEEAQSETRKIANGADVQTRNDNIFICLRRKCRVKSVSKSSE